MLQSGIRIGLQQITSSLNSFIHICIVKRVSAHLISSTWMCCFIKVFVTSRLLTFFESKRYGNIAAGFQSLPPKGVWGHFDSCERHLCDGVAPILNRCLGLHAYRRKQQKEKKFLHSL